MSKAFVVAPLLLALALPACGASSNNSNNGDRDVVGMLDVAGASGIDGWALARSRTLTALDVEIYVDGDAATGRQLAAVVADRPRKDVNDGLGVVGDHGFHADLPVDLFDGADHVVHAYAVTPDDHRLVELDNSPLSVRATVDGHVDPASATIAQLRDLQGDLMLWVPELKPTYVDGVDPVTGIREIDERGLTPRGLAEGWIWSLTIDRYPADKRELIYQAARAAGYTHFAIQVTHCAPGEGYHGLIPVTEEDCVGYDLRLNALLQEIWDHHLIPLCTGVSPTDPVAPGLDKSLCRIVLNDWDNSDQADCHIQVLHETFPDAQIIFEIPQGAITPKPDACSPQPFPATGGAWIRQAQQRWPNFFAVAYEVNIVDGMASNVAELTQAHAFWRDVQEIRFEIDTYWKFWDNLDRTTTAQYNDELQRQVPWLRGFMSGGTTHAPPSGGMTMGDFVGELDLRNATLVHMPEGFVDWPVTTHIQRVEIRQTGLWIELDNGYPNAWPDTPERPDMGPLLMSYGIAEQINGVWYASAPIQLWRGLAESGGAIHSQDIGDGTGRGQIQANWFYDPNRWGPLASHQPAPGEVIGVFVCAGDCRDGIAAYSPVHERSNVVLFALPPPNADVVLSGR